MKCNVLSKTYECTCLLCCSWIGHSDCVGNIWSYLKTRLDKDVSSSMNQPLSMKSVIYKNTDNEKEVDVATVDLQESTTDNTDSTGQEA